MNECNANYFILILHHKNISYNKSMLLLIHKYTHIHTFEMEPVFDEKPIVKPILISTSKKKLSRELQ